MRYRPLAFMAKWLLVVTVVAAHGGLYIARPIKSGFLPLIRWWSPFAWWDNAYREPLGASRLVEVLADASAFSQISIVIAIAVLGSGGTRWMLALPCAILLGDCMASRTQMVAVLRSFGRSERRMPS